MSDAMSTLRRRLKKELQAAERDFERHTKKYGQCATNCTTMQRYYEREELIKFVLALTDRRLKKQAPTLEPIGVE